MFEAKHNEEREYDQLVNWERRLEREAPFFRRVFETEGVRTLADVGAGSARHAIMFRSWGLEVTAIDPSVDMLALAHENAQNAGSDIRIMEGGFGDTARIVGHPVDAITCTGNALPHVRSLAGMRVALNDFAAALRSGGVLVLHYLNHARLIRHSIRTMSPVFRETPGGDKFFLRLLDYTPARDGILFDFVTLVRDPSVREGGHTIDSWPATLEADALGGWSLRTRRSLHFAMPYDMITGELERAGFVDINIYGDHQGKPLDPDTDESIVLLARRV
ncbi:MAG: class I SAM-dependent methyltransferase [Coriobacteriia bacterium]|nr:class I SAM-dependent methyltransferase [Coriobacteriia bacterium]MBN2822202.1 class I SAM-dependent methyltransferase [Coriobacteriia bacterium]